MYALLLTAIVLGFVATTLARRFALARGIVNHPNPIIRDHTTAVAYLGGVGILVGAYLTMALLPVMPGTEGVRDGVPFPASIAVGGLLFGFLGLMDDMKGFTSHHKFLYQFIALGITYLIASLTGQGDLVHAVTGWLPFDAVFSALWILAVVNAMNFVDVCDGLAGSLSAILLIFFAWFFSPYPALALALSGACVGFLALNRPPARIFMGDAGSNFLGFMLGAFTVTETSGSGGWPWITLMSLWTSIPLFELLFLTVVRLKKGLPWWKGSPDHFSLRLQEAGFSKGQVDLLAVGFATFFWGLSVMLVHLTTPGQVLVTLGGIAIVAWMWRWVARWEVSR